MKEKAPAWELFSFRYFNNTLFHFLEVGMLLLTVVCNLTRCFRKPVLYDDGAGGVASD